MKSFKEFKKLILILDRADLTDLLHLYIDGDSELGVCFNCNDIFFWACADAEEIQNKEDIELLEEILEQVDIKDGFCVVGDLYCAKKKGIRPQGAAYTYYPKKYWPLFNSCGPEREVNMANPYKPGQYRREVK